MDSRGREAQLSTGNVRCVMQKTIRFSRFYMPLCLRSAVRCPFGRKTTSAPVMNRFVSSIMTMELPEAIWLPRFGKQSISRRATPNDLSPRKEPVASASPRNPLCTSEGSRIRGITTVTWGGIPPQNCLADVARRTEVLHINQLHAARQLVTTSVCWPQTFRMRFPEYARALAQPGFVEQLLPCKPPVS